MHVQGGPLKFSTGPVVDVAADGTRLRYLNDTGLGSSGAPCLSRDFELVGMHLGTNPDSGPSGPRWNFGVPVAAIAADLERKGLGGATQVAFA
jgi:V8-like Glu-specific endopeptidase